MTYFIFLKYLRSLEEFKKNPHVKIPPKSFCANFQSLDIFKYQIFIRKRIFPSLLAHPAFRPSHGPFSFLFNRPFFPFSTGPRPLGRPSPPSQPNRSSSSSRTKAKCHRRHRSCAAAQRHPGFTPPWVRCPELHTASRARYPSSPLHSTE
jgi:hypothetical protein